jgi:DNA-binding transcriptional regulator YhcF (GntR family)
MFTKKDLIIKWLHEFKRLSTSRFTGLLSIDYNSVIKLLEEMEQEGLITKQKETNATYWVLKEK